jgi:hypothetical protein
MNYVFENSKTHYNTLDKVAIAYSEFCLQKPKNNQERSHKKEIFEAQNQLKKYVNSLVTDLFKIASNNFSLNFVIFNFLCIVLDGLLYEAKVDGDSLELNEINHIILKSEYRPYEGLLNRPVLIDVVKRDFFEEYLSLIKKDE